MYKADDGEIIFTDNSTNETTDVISLKGSDLKKYREKQRQLNYLYNSVSWYYYDIKAILNIFEF